MIIRTVFALGASSLGVFGQVYTPPEAQKPAPSRTDSAPAAQAAPAPAGPLGQELPFLDPSSEVVTWNGKSWSATDNRFFGARFEKYLSEPPDSSEGAALYRKTIDGILASLAPTNEKGPQLREAFKMLPLASAYEGDAKLCDSLAQAVYSALLAKNDIRGVKDLTSAMEQERQRLIRNADLTAEDSGLQFKQDGQVVRETRRGKGVASIRYQDAVRRIEEISALQALQTSKTELRVVQAKVQFQAMIVQFFAQRRFEHVVMAARFYTLIWRDGDTSLNFDKNSETGKLFTEGFGMNPTVGTLDSLANEAIRDVRKGVEGFRYLLKRDELTSAAKRLTEAYTVGEFLPAITTLDYESKRKIQLFVRQSYQLIAAMDVRDYGTAQGLLETLDETVADFDGTKPRAAIATYTRASDMSIMMAKNHFAQGNAEKAQGAIKSAMEAWPQNPKLDEFDELVERGGSLFQARNDFDRLFSEKNYREIVKRQYELVPAISDDESKMAAFEQIMTSIKEIEGGLFAANQLADAGQNFDAWERLTLLREDYPDDPVLGQRVADLSSRVAEFSNALERAKQLEERTPQQTGSALSWYLEAKRLHPGSRVAGDGVKRLLDEVMAE